LALMLPRDAQGRPVAAADTVVIKPVQEV